MQCDSILPLQGIHCMYSIYCSYPVLLAVDLQYILHPTESILHFGLGKPADYTCRATNISCYAPYI